MTCKKTDIDRYRNGVFIPYVEDAEQWRNLKIGDQIWMAQNLDVDHYRNGDAIPNVQDNEMWRKLKTGARRYYLNKAENRYVYGKLYNWMRLIQINLPLQDGTFQQMMTGQF